jgi:eukaryotic-like serine/threonine-protein kinase
VPAPSRLGRYAVRRRIGSGGFATVWLAYDEHLDSPVAVKVLADNWAGDPQVRQRFVEEGRFLRKVESPHVVPVYDAGELEDGRPYLVMAYADQGNLADRLELGPLPLGQAVAVIRQVGQGLHALHQRGVLHRDVKPANVLFRTVDGEVRAMVGDLGLGKALDVSSRLTMIAGTPSYISPEQALGEHLDARADVYSLGALSYLLLAGRPPFTHASLAAAADPSPPAPLGADLPDEVESALGTALAPDREDRWPDVPSYVAALEGALGEHPAARASGPEAWIPPDPELTRPAPRPSPVSSPTDVVPLPTRRRRRLVGVLLGLLALALGAAAGFSLQQGRTREVTVTDDSGQLSVTVPHTWAAATATSAWVPPSSRTEFAALSAGSAPGWNEAGSTAPGVFLGLFLGDHIPSRIPDHPECDSRLDPVVGTSGGIDSTTVTFTGCPGVTVERVLQVTENRLLWVQVRSDDRATANGVLDGVSLHGL